MKQIQNLKYMRFIVILGITGICFFAGKQIVQYRQDISVFNPAKEDGEQNVPYETITGQEEKLEAGDGGEPVADVPSSTNEPTQEEDIEPVEKQLVYETVDESYFDDAVFIGDSRTVGLSDYAGLDNTTFYASTGLTVYKLFSAEVVPVAGSKQKKTIEEALSERQFAKIYLMIGINEMGTGTVDTFMEKYKEVVAHLQELQPDAIIYVQAIMRVSTERSAQGDYITNEGIDARNAEIAKLADNQRIFYLDVNPCVCDEDGGLTADYTFDGVHLKAKYIDIWKQFLMEHAICVNNC